MSTEHQIRDAAKQLLDRIDTERARPSETGPTHLIGGLAKIGSRMEALLLATLQFICEHSQLNPRTLISGSLSRATAGKLAYALKSDTIHPYSISRVLIADIKAEESIIMRVIRLRNAAAHDEEVNPKQTTEALGRLRDLVQKIVDHPAA